MPVRYIGRPTTFRGKYLFEILRNLKNFGVGRVVVRSLYERYPEPCYYTVRAVQPEMDAEGRLGSVTMDVVFRGRHMGEMSMNNGYKADWRLIPKVEEEVYKTTYRSGLDTLPPKNIVPAAVPFPPLLKMMIRDEAVKQGKPLEKEPMLPLTILRDIWHTPVQEGVEAPLGAASSPSNPGVNTMLPQSMAGKIYLSNINPKKPKNRSS